MANTLVATDYKDPPLINDKDGIDYIVRRLTPTECARLQGFPDWWCSDLGTEEPTADEKAFWTDVFETHRKIVTHASKPKTEAQIIKWLKDPHTDSAEYKMWGNGIALPNAVFVLAGITVGVISWGAMGGSKDYCKRTRKAKKNWCDEFFADIFTEFHVVKYGTPKHKVAKEKDSILVDDNAEVRQAWKGETIDANENIISLLKELLEKLT